MLRKLTWSCWTREESSEKPELERDKHNGIVQYFSQYINSVIRLPLVYSLKSKVLSLMVVSLILAHRVSL